MIPAITFSIVAAALVFLAGRKDMARDPRLTVALLVLSAAFPIIATMMPKLGILPAPGGMVGDAGFPIRNIFVGIWAVGFMMAAGRLIVAAMELRRWRKYSVEVDLVNGVKIYKLEGLRGPMAAGVFKPVVFVPASWSEWPEESRRVVLEHELAHHRRRDPLWRLLAELACAVHWYNPLVRWMVRRFKMQCEYACDEMVLGTGIDAKMYARVLCDYAEPRSLSPLAISLVERSALESRVRRMLMPARGSNVRALFMLGGLGLVAACSLAMIGEDAVKDAPVSAAEIQIRLTADPFPGEW